MQRLITAINNDGRIYPTQTRVGGRFVIRFQAGQFEATADDIDAAFDVILEIARSLPATWKNCCSGIVRPDILCFSKSIDDTDE